MSDTPDQKVEDVLSSVRRLVSSEIPRKSRSEVPTGPGALVLTKDHMVQKDRAVQVAARSLEDRIAELEEAVGGQDTEFEPDGSEDQAQHRPDRIVYTRPPVVEGSLKRVKTRRLSRIALIESGPANGDAGDDAGDENDAEAEALDAPEFRRESKIRPDAPVAEPKSLRATEVISDTSGANADIEAPMAEDVPTVARTSAEVSAFSDPDDVVRAFEARIEAGRPISDPSPLNPVSEETSPEDTSPEIAAKTDAEPKVADPVADTTTAEAEDTSEDFDTALSKAVAASLSGMGIANTDMDGAHVPEDYVDAGEFDGISDPEVTASELLSPDDAEDADATPKSDALLLVPETEIEAKDDAPTDDVSTETDTMPAAATETENREADKDTDGDDSASDVSEHSDQAIAALAALPDEEATRLLIARMIRAELQGDLGEQITRNVRKLVRREIKRALSADDLT